LVSRFERTGMILVWCINSTRSDFSETVCFQCKFKCFERGIVEVLHISGELHDDMPDILDVPISNRLEFDVNCSSLNSCFNEQKN
jgi:hypothetical protein